MSRLTTFVSTNQTELTRFFKFAIVGTLGAVIDFGTLNLLVLLFGVPKEIANLVSFSCAVVSNFIWNRLWTFPESRERELHTQFGQFAAVNVVGLVVNEIIFVASDRLVFAALLPHPLDYNVAKAVAVIVVLFWNFFVNRHWTYRGI